MARYLLYIDVKEDFNRTVNHAINDLNVYKNQMGVTSMTVKYLYGNPDLATKNSPDQNQSVSLENVTIGVGFAGVAALLTMILVTICVIVLV